MAAFLDARGAKALALAASGALALAGCSFAGRGERTRAPEVRSQSIEAGGLRLETLAPQRMDAGQCGLFLWAQGSQQPAFIFAAFNEPAEARVRPNGRERTLARTAVDGQAYSGVYENQTFTDGRLTVTVEVTFDPNRALRDGAVVDHGVLRLRNEDGWETILPIGGMAACQN